MFKVTGTDIQDFQTDLSRHLGTLSPVYQRALASHQAKQHQRQGQSETLLPHYNQHQGTFSSIYQNGIQYFIIKCERSEQPTQMPNGLEGSIQA